MEREIWKIRNSIVLIVGLFILTGGPISVLAGVPRWYSKLKQIKPLKTTRVDIEKLFGNPKIHYNFLGKTTRRVEYKIKSGELSVSYSLGKCTSNSIHGYNVEKDTVLRATLYLDKLVKRAKLKLDLRDFQKSEISDVIGKFGYSNHILGQYYVGNERRGKKPTIDSINYYPRFDQEKLSCKSLNSSKVVSAIRSKI